NFGTPPPKADDPVGQREYRINAEGNERRVGAGLWSFIALVPACILLGRSWALLALRITQSSKNVRTKDANRKNRNPCRVSTRQERQFGPRKDPMKKVFLTSIAALFLATPAFAEPINPADIWVIDGDTIQVYRPHPNVRLVGLNAPETRNAACQAEAELGARATRRLRELVKLGNLDFTYVHCSCPEATQGTPICNWGRTCGTLRTNGKDVGVTLIAEELAVSFKCGVTSCPKTPRPWCTRQP